MQYLGNREPPLDEVFADPIVHLLLARDRLSPDEARSYAESARRRLHQRPTAQGGGESGIAAR